MHTMPRKFPKYHDNLAEFVKQLRKIAFSTQKEAGIYFNFSHTTIGRYERNSAGKGILPDVGYVACLANLVWETVSENGQVETAQQKHLLYEVNEAIRWGYPREDELYPDEPIFDSWHDLCHVANSYLVGRQIIKTDIDKTILTPQPEVQIITRPPNLAISPAPDWRVIVYTALKWPEAQLTPDKALQILGVITIWVLGIGLFEPFFDWPLTSTQAVLIACSKFGFVTMVLPFCIVLIYHLDEIPEQVSNQRHWWVLQLNGAYFGFHIGWGSLWLIQMLLYGVDLQPPFWARQLLWFGLVWFIYATTYFFPANRLTEEGLDYYPDIDQSVLIYGIVWGPLFATFFYLAYPTFFQPIVPYLILVALLIAILKIRRDKAHPG